MRSDVSLPISPDGDRAAGTRSEGIAAAIRQAVIEHRLAPGTRLSEDQIGVIFGASRTIVRSALQSLAHDHIVTLAKNRGASVASPTVRDARHLFDARRLLEEQLVRRAAARMDARAAADLAGLIAAGQGAMHAADRGRAIRLSGEFHLRIAALADQPVLLPFLAELISRSSLVIALYGRGRLADCGAAEHQALLEALTAEDGEAAAALMRHHLAHIEADLDLEEPKRATLPLAAALFARAASA